jgi:hypothetical protein
VIERLWQIPGEQDDRALDQVEYRRAVGVEDVEIESEILRRVDLTAVEPDAVERLVLLDGVPEPVGLGDPLKGPRLVERQAVGVDARLIRPDHQLEIEPRPTPRPAVDDDLDHRQAQKADRRRDVEVAGAGVCDLERGRAGPDDLLDQDDRIVRGAGTVGTEQPRAAGRIAERQATGRPGLRGPAAGRKDQAEAKRWPDQTPDPDRGSRPR